MIDVFKLLAELAEKNKDNPRFQALKEYSENPPIQPGAMIGMTKLEGAKQLVRPFLKKSLSETDRKELLGSVQFWNNLPPKVRHFIKKITPGPVEDLEAAYFGGGRRQVVIPHEKPDLDTFIHEVMHATQDITARKRGKDLDKLTRNLPWGKEQPGAPLDFETVAENVSEDIYRKLMEGYQPLQNPYKILIRNIDELMKTYMLKK